MITQDVLVADAEVPGPGLAVLDGAVVAVPACELWPAHEAYAAPCWIGAAPQLVGAADNVAPPTVAQLCRAQATGVIAALSALEQTASELPLADGQLAVLAFGPRGAALGASALARRCVPLGELRPSVREVARPCVPRHGRGAAWPAVRDPLGGDDAWLLDEGDQVVVVVEDAGWALIARTPYEHALGWIFCRALAAERSDEPPPVEAAGLAEPAGLGGGSDAPVVDAIVAVARAALAARPGASELPEALAALLEVWGQSELCADDRLGALAATDLLVLALVAAPALDRSVERAYRELAGPSAPVTVGLVAELACSRPVRARVHRRLGDALPLRTTGAVLIDDAHDVPAVSVPLAVAPWVVTALFG